MLKCLETSVINNARDIVSSVGTKREKRVGGVSEHQEKEEEEEEEEGLFKADAVNKEDPERDRATLSTLPA